MEHEPPDPAEVQNVRGRLTAAKASSIVGTAQVIGGELHVRLDSSDPDHAALWLEFSVRIRSLLALSHPEEGETQ